MTEVVGRDERLHARLAEDVANFLGTVEVHDRNHDRAEIRDRVKGDRGLRPVRELERDDVAGADAARSHAGRQPAGAPVDLAEGSAVRVAVGAHDERVVRGVAQPGGQQFTQALVAPETLSDVAISVCLVDCAGREVHPRERYFPRS